jgi:hypothetical protein
MFTAQRVLTVADLYDIFAPGGTMLSPRGLTKEADGCFATYLASALLNHQTSDTIQERFDCLTKSSGGAQNAVHVFTCE